MLSNEDVEWISNELKERWSDFLELLKESWKEVKKTKKGYARDTHLRIHLSRHIEKYYREKHLIIGHIIRNILADEIIETAIAKGILKVVSNISKPIYYAHSGRFGKGIKGWNTYRNVVLSEGVI